MNCPACQTAITEDTICPSCKLDTIELWTYTADIRSGRDDLADDMVNIVKLWFTETPTADQLQSALVAVRRELRA